jgi:hypothetical protein
LGQADADALPEITDTYAFKDLNKAVVHVNTQFAMATMAKPAPHKKGDEKDMIKTWALEASSKAMSKEAMSEEYE